MLLVMLATLSTAPNLITSGIIPSHSLLLSDGFLYSVMGIIAVLFILERAGQNLLARNRDINTQANILYQSLSHTAKIPLLLQLVIILLAVLSTGLYTIASVQDEITAEVTQTIRVLAKVRPIGISDSNYYPQADMGYRQLAVIESAEPLTLAHFGNHSNKSSLTNTQTANRQLDYLVGKKVLLSARFNGLAKNTQLPTGFSKDFTGLNALQPTQSTQMMLALTPVARADEGFIHRWLRSRHVNAQARVLAYQQGFITLTDNKFKGNAWQTQLNQWRWQVREHFLQGLNKQHWEQLPANQQQAQAVVLSLLTGDRALINQHSKNLYQLAGISHLLAISGTHVLFLAVMLTAGVIALLNRGYPMIYQRISRSQMRWLVMVFGATVYALFTGFDVPSARTVYMLIGVGVARWLIVDMSARQVLLIIAVIMAIIDPYVLWQAGFWLSFVAVMLLISYEISMNTRQARSGKDNKQHSLELSLAMADMSPIQKLSALSKSFMPFVKLQLWIFLALLPLSLLLFGKVSLWGVLVNMFAIGIYGWIIVPLNLLAGVFYLVVPSVADMLWRLLAFLLEGLHGFLAWLVGLGDIQSNQPSFANQAWLYTSINAGMILIMILIALPMLLPRHTMSKVWSLPPLLLLMMLLANQNSRQLDGQFTSQNQFQAKQMTTTDKPIYLTLLDNKASSGRSPITSILLRHGDSRWLILAEHHKYSQRQIKQQDKQSYQKQLSILNKQLDTKLAQKLSANWFEVLAKNGVSPRTGLTGIIVQTPSPTLIQASQSLKQSMPVGYLWQAGKKQLNVDSQSVLPCTSGRSWQSEDGKLSIKAMTGWQEIKDSNVWACVIQINGAMPILINHQYPVYWSAKDGINDKNEGNKESRPSTQLANINIDSEQINNKAMPAMPTINQVLINAGNADSKLWQLWQLLCLSEQVKQGQTDSKHRLLISHSYDSLDGLPNELLDEVAVDNLLLSDKMNGQNQQKLKEITLAFH